VRRIVIAVMGTISTLVMLFAFDASHRPGGATTALGGNGAGSGATSTDPGATGASDDTGTLGSGDPGSTGSVSMGSGSMGSGSADGGTPAATTASAAPTAAGTKKATTGAKTYVGDTVMTHWGPVQVQITVKNSKIVKSRAVVYPNSNGRDIEINNFALPILDRATVGTQSANFDNVSGATVTTDGYKQSLQSALDQAHL
jgi:uncharacterized protein with FMN-binding domain